jgi:hypothetical protein
MGKLLLIALLLPIVIGCEQKPREVVVIKPEEVKPIKPEPSKMDTFFIYFNRHMDYKFAADQSEIKYLRTGNDKYRIEGNKQLDSVQKYAKLLIKYTK